MVNSAFEKISAGLNDALDIARCYPVVTEQMVAFGKAAFFARHLGDMDGMIEAIYIAMHTARPLSEGPV